MTRTFTTEDITTVILAGGRGRRMGGQDKGLVNLNDKPLIEYVIDAIQPQCQRILINANRNLEQYTEYGLPVITDETDEFQGPLSGMLAGILAAKTQLVLTMPCDVPNVPLDYAQRMLGSMNRTNSRLSVAYDGKRLQPVHTLIHKDLQNSLESSLRKRQYKVIDWLDQTDYDCVNFSDFSPGFRSMNEPEDYASFQASNN